MNTEKDVVLSASFFIVLIAGVFGFIGLLEVLIGLAVLLSINILGDIYTGLRPEQYIKKEYTKDEIMQTLDSMSNDVSEAEKILKGKIYIID